MLIDDGNTASSTATTFLDGGLSTSAFDQGVQDGEAENPDILDGGNAFSSFGGAVIDGGDSGSSFSSIANGGEAEIPNEIGENSRRICRLDHAQRIRRLGS